jgi:hypothetical protein
MNLNRSDKKLEKKNHKMIHDKWKFQTNTE